MATALLPSTLSFRGSLIRQFNHSSSVFVNTHKHVFVGCYAKKKIGFFDQILDYIEGGPKLRKWYGAPDLLPKDGAGADEEDENEVRLLLCSNHVGAANWLIHLPSVLNSEEKEEEEEEEEVVRDAVLVTDGDSEMGQMIILSLIIKRTRVKALVKDKRMANEAFGDYVESVAGDMNSKQFLNRALRGVRTIICPTEGFLYNVGSLKGVKHIILLSQLSVYEGSSGIQAVMRGSSKKLAEQDESKLRASGLPYTLIRAGALQDTPGGERGFCFDEGCSTKGSLSKEDAAMICVEALSAVPQGGFAFEVVNGEERVSDWKQCLVKLMEKAD